MYYTPLALTVFQSPSWVQDLWNASSANASLWQTTLISGILSILTLLITHGLSARRENDKWAKQNTLHALHRSVDFFYSARKNYDYLIHADKFDVLFGSFRTTQGDPNRPFNAPRDWGPLDEEIQRFVEALIDIQLSSGKYRRQISQVDRAARSLVESLDEIYVSYSCKDSEGRQVEGARKKSEIDYLCDCKAAILEYETCFREFRETATLDLTSKWTTRTRRNICVILMKIKQFKKQKGVSENQSENLKDGQPDSEGYPGQTG